MDLSRQEQLLIDTIKGLPPNFVYLHAPKRAILKGFQFFTSRRVVRVNWEERGVLVVDLSRHEWGFDVSIEASVRLSLAEGDLVFRCSCGGGGSYERCEHIICALMAVLNLTNPRLFNMTRENPRYRSALEEGLLKRPPSLREQEVPGLKVIEFRRPDRERPVPRYSVVIEMSGGGLRAFVETDGRRVNERDDFRLMPWEIAYLARCSYQRDMSYILPTFLRKADNLHPLFFQRDGKRHRVEWLGERSFRTWTEIEAREDRIVLRKGFALEGDEPVMVNLSGNIAFTEDWTGMCYVAGREGWLPWEELRSACLADPLAAAKIGQPTGREIHIPLGTFRDIQIFLKKNRAKELLAPIKCFDKGRETSSEAVTADSFRLVISRAKEGEGIFLIEPQCLWNTYAFRPSQQIVSFAREIEWGRVPASVRTKKRKPVLYAALFQMLSQNVRKGITERLKEVINEDTFGRRHFAVEARRIVKQGIDKFREEELQFHYTHQGWRVISVDKEKEGLLFLVPYSVFGAALFERLVRDGTSMVVREEQLLDRLHLLHELAQTTGIGLTFDEYPVESVTWELELDATTGTIDWFEIKPEIKCNGRSIPRELWEQALARKGVVVRDGAIQILSRKSLEALSVLSGLWGKTKAASSRSVVSVPRLRIIELFSIKKRGIAVRLSPEDEAIMDRLTCLTRIESRPPPEGLRGRLRHYQQEGYEWLAFLYEHHFGACLADDMGLGKTIQAIALMGAIKEGKARSAWSSKDADTGPMLIVVPPSLLFNWEQEIERFFPSLRVYVYRGKDRSTEMSGFDVMLTSYGMVRRDIARLKEMRFCLIVFDEAQAIKNIYADTTSAVRQLKAFFKVALTGTPVENHVGEYFSIIDLVLPGLLGDYREFQGSARNDLSALLPVITERTRPFMLRRTKEHILTELPPKIERDVYLDLTEQQKKFYNRTVQEVRSTIESAYRSNTASQAKIIALTAIMRLRQICLSPRLLVRDMKEPSPKVEFLREKLEELFSESHSVLVFSQFTSFLNLVEDELKRAEIAFFRLDGSTPVAKRKEIVHSFQTSPAPSVFLLSLKAGGQGLNLTRATYVFHLDPWWNPAVENQASDRSHRIGQTNKVIVTRLLMRHTVEEKMMALKHRKQGLYRALMEAPEKSVARAITREDFSFLLT